MSGFLFGGSVALNDNGDKVVVSIPESDANGANSGQVRVFSVGGIQYTSPPYSGCTDSLAVNYDPYSFTI